jgi:hypothetical protein
MARHRDLIGPMVPERPPLPSWPLRRRLRRLKTRLMLFLDRARPDLAFTIGMWGVGTLILGLADDAPLVALTGTMQIAIALVLVREMLRNA